VIIWRIATKTNKQCSEEEHMGTERCQPQPPARCCLYRRLVRWSWHAPLPHLRCKADGSTHHTRGDHAGQRV